MDLVIVSASPGFLRVPQGTFKKIQKSGTWSLCSVSWKLITGKLYAVMHSVSPTVRAVLHSPLFCDENSTVLLGIVKRSYSHAHGGTHGIAGLWSSGFYQFGEGATGLNSFQSHRIKLGIQGLCQAGSGWLVLILTVWRKINSTQALSQHMLVLGRWVCGMWRCPFWSGTSVWVVHVPVTPAVKIFWVLLDLHLYFFSFSHM